MWRKNWVILWSLWVTRVVRQPTLPVPTTSGWVRGSVAHSGTHMHYLSIPYATLNGRFQAPGPEPTWNGIFEAINENVVCRQPIFMKVDIPIGQKDCLILNIYTPLDVPPDKSLPVMVFIHGGGYFHHFSSRIMYGPEYLVSKEIILVTFNYRLSAQGFLCLGIKEAPGNAGMKDQVAALKWVQKNIRAFGGDPDNVTIFGESAGGASVSNHILSPMSKGLFHKGIIQSGSSIAAWTFQYNPVAVASRLAKALGLESQEPHDLYKFFMSKSDDELILKLPPRKKGSTLLSEILFRPCVEKKLEGEEAFLTESPYDILTKGEFNNVPVIIGANTDEGLVFLAVDQDKFIENVDFKKGLPEDLAFPEEEIANDIGVQAKIMYMGSNDTSLKDINKLSRFYVDPYLIYHLVEETELLAKFNSHPVYHYIFRYDGGRNMLKRNLMFLSDVKATGGATHIDELFYLFSQQLIPSFFENKIIDKMTSLWTNFAKYGNPTPSVTKLLPVLWPAVTPGDQRALLIDQEFSVVPLWYDKNLLFWKNVYSKYRRKL